MLKPLKLAPRYFLLPDIFSIKPDNGDLVNNLILTLLHKLHYLNLLSFYTLYYCCR